MTGVSIFVNLVICAVALALRRDLLNPLFSFSFVWAATLSVLLISSNDYYQISIETEVVFILGSIGFMLGNLLAEFLFQDVNSTNQSTRCTESNIQTKYLWFTLSILVLGWFEYYREISKLTSGIDFFYIFRETRYALIQAGRDGEKLLGPIANLEIIAVYFAMLCVVERGGRKSGHVLAYCALVVAAFYVVLSGSKGGLVAITLSVFFLHSFNRPWRQVARRGVLAFIAVLILFCFGLIMINYAYDGFANSIELLDILYSTVRNYWIGGLLAFDQVLADPTAFVHFQSISRFFLETANSLGATFYVPPIHGEFVHISDTETTNVFTMYYSYYLDGGLAGVLLLSFLYSCVVGCVYLKAKMGDKRYLLMYSLLLTGIVFSIVSERFFLGLNGLIKAFIFWWVFYFLFSIKRQISPNRRIA